MLLEYLKNWIAWDISIQIIQPFKARAMEHLLTTSYPLLHSDVHRLRVPNQCCSHDHINLSVSRPRQDQDLEKLRQIPEQNQRMSHTAWHA